MSSVLTLWTSDLLALASEVSRLAHVASWPMQRGLGTRRERFRIERPVLHEVVLLVAVLLEKFVQRTMLVQRGENVCRVFHHFGTVDRAFGVQDASHLRHTALLHENLGVALVLADDFVERSESRGDGLVRMTPLSVRLLQWIGQNGEQFFDRPSAQHVAVLRIDGQISQGDGCGVDHRIALVDAQQVDQFVQTAPPCALRRAGPPTASSSKRLAQRTSSACVRRVKDLTEILNAPSCGLQCIWIAAMT